MNPDFNNTNIIYISIEPFTNTVIGNPNFDINWFVNLSVITMF